MKIGSILKKSGRIWYISKNMYIFGKNIMKEDTDHLFMS